MALTKLSSLIRIILGCNKGRRIRVAVVAASMCVGWAVHAQEPARLPRAMVDALLARQILALSPERITARDVREILVRAPAPRIVLLQGSVAAVTMRPFAEFLIAMGFPADRLRRPQDGALSWPSSGSSEELAGTLAWHFEADGMMPLLVGHSQGGMLAIRTLHELAGAFHDSLPVWNPVMDKAESRATIIDPLTGQPRAVVGLQIPFVAALATGKLPRLVLGQWSMLAKLRSIPDTVEEFTGFAFEWDLIAGQFPGAEPYRATGSAHVRNITLPPGYSHIALPRTQHLAAHLRTRRWIDEYVPGTATATLPDADEFDSTNLLHAADIWYSVKKHWCLAVQRLIVARGLPSE
ncbi:MAG: hypothetical protein H0T80_06450 [Betaproteobacteria bacterium]|nr:hypothetical protein [Betaproteobacteria bacterium]